MDHCSGVKVRCRSRSHLSMGVDFRILCVGERESLNTEMSLRIFLSELYNCQALRGTWSCFKGCFARKCVMHNIVKKSDEGMLKVCIILAGLLRTLSE